MRYEKDPYKRDPITKDRNSMLFFIGIILLILFAIANS